jgi:hypothetical protein
MWISATLVALSAARVVYVLATYEFGLRGTTRYHVESAVCAFLIIGAIVRLTRRETAAPAATEERVPAWLWPLFALGALLLYWPALRIGYLSDDFDLQRLASEWHLGAVTTSLFRPVPMAAWAMLQNAGAGSAITHALNIVLHGTNAFLTVRVCAGWSMRRSAALLGGAMMLTSPLGVEPVAWSAGLFDVSATAAVLALILQGRRYESAPVASRLLFVATAIFAVACKETAVIGVPLVIVDLWMPGRLRPRVFRDMAVLCVVAAVYGLIRIANAGNGPDYLPTRNVLRRTVFEAFGALSVPWHMDVVANAPWLAVTGPLVLLAGFGAFFLSTRTRWPIVVGVAAWVLVTIAPVFRAVIVFPDLQNSRFLYLGGCAWAGLIVALASSAAAPVRRMIVGGVIALAIVDAWAVRTELHHWRDAGALRDVVTSALHDDPAFERCPTVTLFDMPDNVRGAYVFRVGMPEAVRIATGKVVTATAAPDCRLSWDTDSGRFVRRNR